MIAILTFDTRMVHNLLMASKALQPPQGNLRIQIQSNFQSTVLDSTRDIAVQATGTVQCPIRADSVQRHEIAFHDRLVLIPTTCKGRREAIVDGLIVATVMAHRDVDFWRHPGISETNFEIIQYSRGRVRISRETRFRAEVVVQAQGQLP